MNKIDLIIDALEKVINACKLYDRQVIQDGGIVYLEQELEASIKALAAARELRELKPLAYYDKRYDTVMTAYELGNHVDANDVPLYALDEVTK